MRRRVTVDSTKSVRDSAESRRPSVFERLGPGAVRDLHRESSRQDKCRNWLRDGSCPYGDTCHFQHGPYSRGKDRLSDTEPPMDLRHRVESKRAERERHEREAWDDDRSESPPIKEEKRRRSRSHKDSSEKKKKKKKREMSSMVVKQTSEPSSSSSSDEGQSKDWPQQDEEQLWNPEDPDFEYVRELTLERRRQQLQRELERMEREEMASDRDPIEDDNSTNDEKPPKVASPPRKKHSKKKRSHSNSSKHERQGVGEEMEQTTSKASKSHKKHKHSLAVETSPRRDMEKTVDHHGKKKSRKSKSPLAASKAHSPSPLPVKMEDIPKKHKNKEGKKKEKTKKRKYQSDSSDEDKEEEKKRASSTSRSRKKSSSKRHLSQSPKRSPSNSPPRRTKHRDPSPSSQSESSQASTHRGKSPASISGSHASESPRRSGKKRAYLSPSPPRKRSRQPTPEMRASSQSRHGRRGSPDNSRHGSQSLNRGQSPSYKKRARSTSIGSSHRSQSPREHRRSPSPPTRKQVSSRGRGSPGRDNSSSRDRSGQRRPPERMPTDGGRSKSSYDKYDSKRQYSQDRSRAPTSQQRDSRQPGRGGLGRDGSGRDASGRDRGYPQGKDPVGSRSAPAPGRNERVSRRDEWEKKRTRDDRDPRDEPYGKRPRNDQRGSSPPTQKHRQYSSNRDEDMHSADRQSGRYGSHSRSSSVAQQSMSRQDRDRSSSRRPDYPSESATHRGRDNTPDFRRMEHLGDGQRGRDGTPDTRRSDYGSEGKGRGRDHTPDVRRQEHPSDGRKGRDATPDKRQHGDYLSVDGNRKGRDGTPADMRRSEHLSEGGRKGRDNTPDSRRTPDKRSREKSKGDSYGKHDDKRDVRKFEERGKDSVRDQQRGESTRGADGHRDSRSRASSRGPPVEPERQLEIPQIEVPPINVPKPTEQSIKREKLKTKTDSIESKVSSSASEAKGSPALERKFSRFSEPFSDWSDEGSDGLLTRSSTPLEHERNLGNRQQRPSRSEPPVSFEARREGTGQTDVPINGAEKTGSLPQMTSEPSIVAEQGTIIKELEDPSQMPSEVAVQGTEEPATGGDVFPVGDAYEEISDDELDDILEENEAGDENQATESKSMTEVDWNSLVKDIQPLPTTTSQEGTDTKQEAKVSILEKFSPANVLKRVGVSRALAGPALMKEIEALCRQGDKTDDKESSHQPPLFEEQLGALNATAHQRYEQRKRLLTDVGPCRRALCARRDIMIRKQLRKDKDTEQVFSNPVIDTELYRLSLQLFRTKRPSLASPLESKDSGLILKGVSVTS